MHQQEGSVLESVRFGMHESIRGRLREFRGVPTLGGILVAKAQGRHFVGIRREPFGNLNYVQGRIRDTETFMEAFLRIGENQVGMTMSHVQRYHLVGEFVNPMPEERKAKGRNKQIVVLVAQLSSTGWIDPVKKIVWFDSREEFDTAIATGNRPLKIEALRAAVDGACKLNYLPQIWQGRTVVH